MDRPNDQQLAALRAIASACWVNDWPDFDITKWETCAIGKCSMLPETIAVGATVLDVERSCCSLSTLAIAFGLPESAVKQIFFATYYCDIFQAKLVELGLIEEGLTIEGCGQGRIAVRRGERITTVTHLSPEQCRQLAKAVRPHHVAARIGHVLNSIEGSPLAEPAARQPAAAVADWLEA